MSNKDIKIYGTLLNHTVDNTIAYAAQILDEGFENGTFQDVINSRVRSMRNEGGKTYIDSDLVVDGNLNAEAIYTDEIFLKATSDGNTEYYGYITYDRGDIKIGSSHSETIHLQNPTYCNEFYVNNSSVVTQAELQDSESAVNTSIRDIISEEIAKVVAGAPASLDTLKEISDWISSHESDAASMNSQIQTNKGDIATIKQSLNSLGTGSTSVSDWINNGYSEEYGNGIYWRNYDGEDEVGRVVVNTDKIVLYNSDTNATFEADVVNGVRFNNMNVTIDGNRVLTTNDLSNISSGGTVSESDILGTICIGKYETPEKAYGVNGPYETGNTVQRYWTIGHSDTSDSLEVKQWVMINNDQSSLEEVQFPQLVLPRDTVIGDLPVYQLLSDLMTKVYTNPEANQLIYTRKIEFTEDLSNVTCPVTLSDGQQCHVIYKNTSSAQHQVTVSNSYSTPNGVQISLTAPANGYVEVNYMRVGDNIYVRGI